MGKRRGRRRSRSRRRYRDYDYDDDYDEEYDDDGRDVKNDRLTRRKARARFFKENIQFIVIGVAIMLLVAMVILLSIFGGDSPADDKPPPPGGWEDMTAFQIYLGNSGYEYHVDAVPAPRYGHQSIVRPPDWIVINHDIARLR